MFKHKRQSFLNNNKRGVIAIPLKEEVNKKFANKKAISSEDYAALEDNGSQDSYYSNKIKSMGNTQAISSSDLYGPQESDYTGESLTDKMKDFAINFTLKAAEKAKEVTKDPIKREERRKKIASKLGKRCRCIETGEEYDSVHQAFNITKIYHIDDVCDGFRKTAGGLHWEYI